MRLSRARALGLLAISLLQTRIAFPDQAYFRPLGFMPGGSDSVATKISGDGRVVVGFGSSNRGFTAFRWTETDGFLSLGDLDPSDGVTSEAHGISRDGRVIVGISSVKKTYGHAFLWTQESGMIDLGDLPGGAKSSIANAVSDDAAPVVGESSSTRTGDALVEAFRWNETEGIQPLGNWPRGEHDTLDWAISALDVSNDGAIVVGYAQSDAFLWTVDGGFERLGYLPGGVDARALAISGDGHVIVGFGTREYEGRTVSGAFRWTRGDGMQFIGDIQGGKVGSYALDTNHDGSVIVGYGASRWSGLTAFIWDAERGTRDLEIVMEDDYGLDLQGWRVIYLAWGVSDDGRTICGWGTNADGATEAWVAHLPRCNRYKYPLGDSDGSGAADFNDIDCFVAALIGREAWEACDTSAPRDQYDCVNDTNADGAVDFNDIDGFVECLIEGCP